MEKTSVLLDACVVIELFSIGCWEAVTNQYGIFISEQIVGQADYYVDGQGQAQTIDLQPFLSAGRIWTAGVTATEAKKFLDAFGSYYAERMDPGELELLTFLHINQNLYYICSSDSIVFKTLGRLGLSERALSLDEMLKRIGIEKKLPFQYSKRKADEWLRQGKVDRIQGFGLSGGLQA